MRHKKGEKIVSGMVRLVAVVIIIGGAVAFFGACSADGLNDRPAGQEPDNNSSADMNTPDLSERRVYLYFTDTPSSGQLKELAEMGVAVLPDSWVPPAGAHPAGFLLADIPAGKLEQVEALEFIVRIEFAEEIMPLPDTINIPAPKQIPDRESK